MMGKGASNGKVRDWFKKRGQRTHGETAKRQRLSHDSELRRRKWRAERRAAERQDPSYGHGAK